MANIKIAQLTNATTISDTDIVLIEDATQTKKMTVANLKSLLGINSGGIVESGSNANGEFIKFSNGTMVCWGRGSSVATDDSTWTFPAAFIDLNASVFTQAAMSTVGGSVDSIIQGITKTSVNYRVNSYTERIAATVMLMAIGRWK